MPILPFRDCYGSTALHKAAEQGHPDVLQLLLEAAPELVNSTEDHPGWSPLHHASFRGNPDCCSLCIEEGGDILQEDAGGNTPIRFAREFRNPRCMRILDLARKRGIHIESLEALFTQRTEEAARKYVHLEKIEEILSSSRQERYLFESRLRS